MGMWITGLGTLAAGSSRLELEVGRCMGLEAADNSTSSEAVGIPGLELAVGRIFRVAAVWRMLLGRSMFPLMAASER